MALRPPLALALMLAAAGCGVVRAANAGPPASAAATEAGAEPARRFAPAAPLAPPAPLEASDSPAAGPRPYPDAAAAWPGRGVTRVFGWMHENRRGFWRQRAREQGSVVFAGDSLIAGWRSLSSDFAPLPTANRGIGGDVSRGLLFRFQEDVLELHPQAIVLLIGTNDLSARQAPADTLFNVAALLDLARRHDARVPVVLCTLPPRAHRNAPVEPARLEELNAGIAALAAGRAGVTVVDLVAPFSAADGTLDERYFGADRLHLSLAGYARWRSVLAPVLATLQRATAARRGPARVAADPPP